MTTELVGLDLTTVWGDGSDIFTAGNGAIVAHSGDEGMTWVQVDTSAAAGAATPVYHHIAGSGGGDVWIAGSVGDESVLLHSADHGASWQRRDAGGLRRLSAVWPLDQNQVLLGTADGNVVRSADGGGTWASVASVPEAAINSLWGSAAGYVYAVGGRDPGGAAAAPAAMASTGCDGGSNADPSAAPALSSPPEGVLLRSTDAGRTWAPIGVAPAGTLWDVRGTSVGSVIVASGAHESVVVSSDGGMSWTAEGRPLSPLDLTDVWVDPTGATFFAAADGVVVDLEYSCTGPVGVRTETLPAGSKGEAGAVALWGTDDGDLWAVGPSGIIRNRR
jgi:photosystem II stability/assembly factor-like uncharacterized protein